MNQSSGKPLGTSPLARWSTACLTLLAALTVLSGSASAQVVVTATAGDPGPTGYTTLGSAFAAINAGVPQGDITVSITGDTDESTLSAVLNASGTGLASYTSVAISPSGGAPRTISGATTPGNPLIDLNGADNVTIDGLNTGGNSLTISNTTASPTSGTSTIRFIGGATGNTITNATILGSFSAAVTTNGGNIFFSTDALTANGNDNNTISNNNIGPAGANLPTKGVYGNGSLTTAAIGNNGIVITNNNIFDYFGAAVASAGIYVGGGCSGWTISNNRFFQTAPRTWTTGANNRAIDVQNSSATTGAQGFSITGNTIGFASSAGTGTYTLTGSTGKFAGIVFNGVTGGAVSDISSNTIASVSLTGVTSSGTSTSSPFMAILVTNGVANTNNNAIGSQTGTGSLTFSTNTTISTDVYGLFNFSLDNWTANGNAFGSLTANNAGATGAFIVYLMRANTSTSFVFNAANNTVGGTTASSIQNNSTSTTAQLIGMFTSNARPNFVGNTVRNLTAAGGTGTASSASVIGISNTNTTTTGNLISQNTIQALSNSNAAAAVWVTGVNYNGATTGTNLVQRNFIHSLSTPSTSATATVNGINVLGGFTTYQNNMIVLGNDMAANSPQINGISETAAGTDNFYHNSVYIGGSAVAAGTASSFALQSSIITNVRNYRDNIFFNARSNGAATSKHYAIRAGGTTPNPAGLTSNNNVLLANGIGGLTGLFNAVDQPTLAAWQAATGQDANSFALDPQYLAPTAVTPDLHINPAVLTVVEGNGADVGVTDDFDGQIRSGLTPVDIGADAGNFLGIDLAPPVIAYTPLANTLSTSNRILAATITDSVSGVPTSGVGLPVIYFRKGTSGAFSATQASFGGGSSYNFTIDYSLLGGVVIGDRIQYYVVAQDGAAPPNVTSNPLVGASGFTANPPAAATPPTTPNSYLISAPMSGSKTVCASGCDFSTLTGASGIFGAINDGVATGNIDIQISGDLTVGEDGTNGLNALAEEPAGSNFSVRIYPTGVPRAITGSFNGALVRLNGSSRVTIDGSIGGAGTDRSLTIQNTSVTTPSVVLMGSTGTTPITSNTLKNCVVINGVNTSSAVVISDAGTLGNPGFFSNVTVQNNDIQRAFVGVFATGGTTPQNGSNLTCTQNTLNTSGANAIRNVGLYMQGVNGATVSQNAVGNFDATIGENDVGIWLALGTINATVSGNTVATLGYTGTSAFAPIGINVTSGVTGTNNIVTGNAVNGVSSNGTTAVRGISVSGTTADLTIEKNKVDGVVNTNTGTFGAYGIDISAGNNVVVRNNFVSNVSFNMQGGAAFSTTFGVFGIRVGSGTGHKVYFNSVNLNGALPGTPNSSLLTAAFGLVGTTSTGCDVRDNIFANNITGGTTSIAHVSAYLPSGGTSAMNLTWNSNAYYFGTDAARQGVGQAGTTAGTNFFTTLPALLAYSSTLSSAGTNDNASLASTSAVPFISTSDLHLLPASAPVGAGTPIAGVTTDIDNDPRSSTAPDIGADEIVPFVVDLSIAKSHAGAPAPGEFVVYTITASNPGPKAAPSTAILDAFPAPLACSFTAVGTGGASGFTASGAGSINDTAVNLPGGSTVTYTATCAIPPSASGSLSNTATVTGSAAVTDTDPTNNSATDAYVLVPTADLAVTKTDGVASVTPGGTTAYTIVAANPGPSDAPGSFVADAFPPLLTCTWTCVGAGGATCTGAGAGDINDIVNLPAGGSATYTAACNISPAASGLISNTVTLTPPGTVSDGNPGNNAATDVDGVGPVADLAITKTDGVATAVPGGSVTYTITASNLGPSDAAGSTVADAFPATLTCNWTCVGASGGTCTAAGAGNINDTVNLPLGASVTYTAVCSIARSATGTLSNTATVAPRGSVLDNNSANNSATDTDALGGVADLSITKTDGVTTATPGGSVTYGIVASNAGPSDALGTAVTDSFPASLTCTWTCVGAGGGTCTAAGAGNINDTDNLPVGGSATYTASCNIASSATGSLVNTATSTPAAGITDPVPGNNASTDTDALGASADVSITKTDGVTTAVPGASVTYTIVASNAGPSDAPGNTVADTFPASLTCTWTCVGAGGGTCTASGAGNINDTANLPAGGSATYTATCSIASSATGSLSNTATATPAGGVTDPAPGNNSATDTDTLAPTADVAITKSDGVTTAIPGTSVTYTIVATNPGPSDAPGTTVADTFPASLTCTWTCVGAGGGTCTASGAGNINDTAGLLVGSSATYTAICNIASSATGNLVNTATAAVAAGITDPAPGNNSATDTDTLVPTADIAITKDDGTGNAIPGGTVTYAIDVANAGPSAAAIVNVSDAFPPQETCTWTCVGSGGATCTAGPVSGNITDSITMPAGSLASYTAICGIDPFATGSVSNTATAAPGASTVDPDPSNNTATDTDALVITSDLSVTKTDGVIVALPGGTLTYTIVASNLGPSYAQGNLVSDQFQADLTCTWTCVPDGSGGTTCTSGPVSGDINDTIAVAPGGSVAYTAVCAVSGTATTDITNTVSVTAGPGVTDPDLTNNSAVDVDVLGQALSIADVAVTEGNSGTTPADFVVSLSSAVSATVTVDFTTVDGTATAANNDYTPLAGTLIFAPGELTKVISVSVNGDLKFEPDEDYTVVLSNPTNATIADGTGLGTILNDDTPTSSSKDELIHDSRETRSLGLTPARENPTYFRILQKRQSSYEIVVDATTGDIGSSGPDLDRLDSDGITVLQSSTSATGGSSRSLRFENATAGDVAGQYIRVQSAGCGIDCDPADTYRIRAYDTTYRLSRFNNSATQITVLLVNNPTDQDVTGTLWFWQMGTGTLLVSQPVTLAPKATFVLNTSTVAALQSQSGTVTFSNDAPFGALNGKAVAVETATGFTFDTAMTPRPATTKMVPRDN
jgi:uncharacterized repeat protein (TIGR01451 family)